MPTVNENVEQWNFHKILIGENIFVIERAIQWEQLVITNWAISKPEVTHTL